MTGPIQHENEIGAEQLRTIEDIDRALADRFLSGVAMLDDAFRVVFANRVLIEISGRESLDRIRGVSFLDLLEPESRGRFRLAATSGGEARSGRATYNIVRPDGTTREVEALAGPITLAGRPGHLCSLLDVTERRQAERALKESEARFVSFIRDSAYGYFEFDLQGHFTAANARAEKMVGAKLGDERVLNFAQLILAEDLDRALLDLGAVGFLPNEGPQEYRICRPDGRILHVEVNTLPLRREGEIVGFQSTVLDITARRRYEEELKRREAAMRTVAQAAERFLQSQNWQRHIDGALEGVGRTLEASRVHLIENRTTDDGRILSSLRHEWHEDRTVAGLAISRFQEVDLVGVGFADFLAAMRQGRVFTARIPDLPTERQDFLAPLAMVTFLAVPIFIGENWWGFLALNDNHPERQWSPAEIDILKTLANVLGAAIQRQRAEEALKESELKYRLVVENANDVIWAADLEANLNFLSPSVVSLLGYSAEKALSLKPPDYLASTSLDFWRHRAERDVAAIAERWLSGQDDELESIELEMIRQDGRKIWVEVNWAFSRDLTGRVIGYQGMVHDISRRKSAEEQRKIVQEKLRAQYNAIPVPTYTWQTEGKDFVLVDYNDAAMAITRGTIKDILGVRASILYRDNPDIVADLERCFRERSAFERELLYRYKSLDQEKYLAVKYAFVSPDQVIAHTEDMTEKKKALEALAESERRLQQTLSAELHRRRSKDYDQPSGADSDLQQFQSGCMQRMLAEARLAASSDGNVLVLGKSGVGKTYLAGWIHQHSARADGPFFDINCTALTPSLIESELFGHEAGAFTGSKGRKRGLLELADGGTLFLDEIGDMPPDLQAKLLSFLDTRRFMRVGGEAKIKVNARIMVATNRDLAGLVREGRFREDLYYRLNVISLTVPSLRERKQDIPLLAAEILSRLCRDMGLPQPPILTPQAIRDLIGYDWPGNVRELRNVLERVLLKLENKSVIDEITILHSLHPKESSSKPGIDSASVSLVSEGDFDREVEDYMRRLITEALTRTTSKTEAARALGISRHALNRYIKKFGINARKANMMV